MNFFHKKQKPAQPAARPAPAQIRDGARNPFGILDGYAPLQTAETRLYRAVREAVPVVDAAIYKLIRLTGGFTVRCQDQNAERQLAEFLRTVPVGRGQCGFNAFLECYLDSLLTCGRAVGEIVPAMGGGDVAALLCGRVEDVEIHEGGSPLEFTLCGPDQRGAVRPLPRQDLLLFTPLNPETGSPYGVSLLRSMPFLADVWSKIFQTVGTNWERCGNVRFAVTCPSAADGQADRRSRELAQEWASAMSDTRDGAVRDFVAVGDVGIRVIGADNQILDSAVPVRQILEELIAKTGIPPFMLGLQWSSTERMSAQQADMLTTEITALRRTLTPAVERVCRLWLRMHGFGGNFDVNWDEINLQDEVEEARAALYLEQARKLRLENDAAEKRAAGAGEPAAGEPTAPEQQETPGTEDARP
jgi:hypothetical protein